MTEPRNTEDTPSGGHRRPALQSLAALALAISIGATGCSAPRRDNVLLVTFDTTRADHIGCYGNPRASTPNLDALAAEGVRFERAYTSVPITLPSHTTYMTGRYPTAHGVRDNGVFVVPEEETTLAEILGGFGYRTGAAIASYPLISKFGLDQGFDLYDDHVTAEWEDFRGVRNLPKARLYFDERPAGHVNRAILPWIEEHAGEPFFAWVHYFDPHQPFEPRPPFDQLFFDNPYLGEIAYADECFGAIVEKLKSLGVWDRTIVVVGSDHGEGLGEHGEITHSMLVYDTTVHVPLIVRSPGVQGGHVVSTPVGTVDVAPTIMDLLDLPTPDTMQGRSLVPALHGQDLEPRPLYTETLSPRISHGLGELRAVINGHDKYIHGPRSELYDLGRDPHEVHNLVDRETETVEVLRSTLEHLVTSTAAPETMQATALDEQTQQRLAALGYIHASEGSAETIREELRSDGIPPQDRVGDVNQLSLAKNLLTNNRPLEAKPIIESLLEHQPSNPTLLEMLAMADLRLGLLDDAEETLRRILEDRPDGTQLSAKILVQIGAIHHYRGDHERALEHLRAGDASEPSASTRLLIAAVHATRGDSEAEESALSEALELEPDNAAACMRLAILHARQGRVDEAEAGLRRAVSLQPYFPRPHFNLGTFLVGRADLIGAAQCFERALEVDPRYLPAYYALVAVNIDLGRPDEARRILQLLTERAPESNEARMAAELLVEGP